MTFGAVTPIRMKSLPKPRAKPRAMPPVPSRKSAAFAGVRTDLLIYLALLLAISRSTPKSATSIS